MGWDDAGRPIHLGNVAEFNAQFLPSSVTAEVREQWRVDGDHYANLAMFYSPHPSIVILPLRVDGAWTELLVRQLEWDPVDVYSGLTDDGELSRAVLRRPALRDRVGIGPVLPWGLTPDVELLTGQRMGNALTYESKAATHGLFVALVATGGTMATLMASASPTTPDSGSTATPLATPDSGSTTLAATPLATTDSGGMTTTAAPLATADCGSTTTTATPLAMPDSSSTIMTATPLVVAGGEGTTTTATPLAAAVSDSTTMTATPLVVAGGEGSAGIVVPEQWRVESRREAIRMLAERAAAGQTSVVKAEHGVGGQGTAIITPELVATVGGARRLVRRIVPQDWFRSHGCLLIEEYVNGAGPSKDLTYDALVTDDGTVETVGTGAMIIEGTRYRGVTVGPGVVPAALDATIRAFGEAVGRNLASVGYRGWFDVDFVADRIGRAAPTEVNVRRTGPTVAFALRSRLDRVRGGSHLVRTLDRLPLGARIPEEALFDHLGRLAARCRARGALLITTVPTASFEPLPYVGVALAAHSVPALDAAEHLVRAANAALTDIFTR